MHKTLGNSLIEITIVLAIISVLVTMGIPLYTHYEHQLLEHETNRIYNILFYLQKLSICTNLKQSLYINRNENYFFYFENGKKNIQKLHKLTLFGYIPNTKGPPSKPTVPLKTASTFDLIDNYSIISFTPDGSCNSGTLYLTNAKKTAMCALTCGISQVSCIRKYRYKNNSWLLIIDQKYEEKSTGSYSHSPD